VKSKERVISGEAFRSASHLHESRPTIGLASDTTAVPFSTSVFHHRMLPGEKWHTSPGFLPNGKEDAASPSPEREKNRSPEVLDALDQTIQQEHRERPHACPASRGTQPPVALLGRIRPRTA